jgi:glycine/D-amino acid oxidase-like deaminating enzyme
VYSLVTATEPISEAMWDEIGLKERETFSDYRRLIIYGQRTADDRMVFGGRGAPYHFGSSVAPAFDRDNAIFAELERSLVELFPVLGRTKVTHRWGGPLGVPRDWFASVSLDPTTGLGTTGGYVGDGVGASNLGGRTLADLVLSRSTPRTQLPWVNHTSPKWEPEPLRWIGVNAGLVAMSTSDSIEARTGKQAWRARIASRFTGH